MSEQIEPGTLSHAAQQRQRASQLAQAVRTELQKAVIGQNTVIDDVLTALIAGGHVLLEGVPGLGKTLLVRALARCFGRGLMAWLIARVGWPVRRASTSHCSATPSRSKPG